MYASLKLLFTILLLSVITPLQAQQAFSISGTVKHAKDGWLPAATIFLDGTERKTYSNENGAFKLDQISPGTYQLTVHFIGYKTLTKNVIIEDKSIVLDLLLEHSEETLKEVVITSTVSKNKYLSMFLKSFLGETENGKSCQVLNPGILKFSEQLLSVTAKSNDFLEIINQNLGYKIRYSIRDFKLNRYTSIASYTGECIFESLKGSENEELQWEENRRKAYEGSLMHFIRSLYSNTTNDNGFSYYYILDYNKSKQRLGPPLQTEDFVSHEKKELATIKLSAPLYVRYAPDGISPTEQTASIIAPFLPTATIDSKGSVVDYRSFLIRKYWGTKRLGDQLPYEYTPVKSL